LTRYNENAQEDPAGAWCLHAEAQAEVARLKKLCAGLSDCYRAASEELMELREIKRMLLPHCPAVFSLR